MEGIFFPNFTEIKLRTGGRFKVLFLPPGVVTPPKIFLCQYLRKNPASRLGVLCSSYTSVKTPETRHSENTLMEKVPGTYRRWEEEQERQKLRHTCQVTSSETPTCSLHQPGTGCSISIVCHSQFFTSLPSVSPNPLASPIHLPPERVLNAITTRHSTAPFITHLDSGSCLSGVNWLPQSPLPTPNMHSAVQSVGSL